MNYPPYIYIYIYPVRIFNLFLIMYVSILYFIYECSPRAQIQKHTPCTDIYLEKIKKKTVIFNSIYKREDREY